MIIYALIANSKKAFAFLEIISFLCRWESWLSAYQAFTLLDALEVMIWPSFSGRSQTKIRINWEGLIDLICRKQ